MLMLKWMAKRLKHVYIQGRCHHWRCWHKRYRQWKSNRQIHHFYFWIVVFIGSICIIVFVFSKGKAAATKLVIKYLFCLILLKLVQTKWLGFLHNQPVYFGELITLYKYCGILLLSLDDNETGVQVVSVQFSYRVVQVKVCKSSRLVESYNRGHGSFVHDSLNLIFEIKCHFSAVFNSLNVVCSRLCK